MYRKIYHGYVYICVCIPMMTMIYFYKIVFFKNKDVCMCVSSDRQPKLSFMLILSEIGFA